MAKRSTRLNDEVQRKIVDALRAGNYTTVASRYAGIAPSTFYRWMKRGKEARSGPYRAFYEVVRQAETYAEIRAVAIIQREMEDNWRAAVAYLERKFPARWGRNRSEAPGPRRPPVRVAEPVPASAGAEDAAFAEILRILLESGAFEARAAEVAPPAPDERGTA